jgi:spore germination protein Q
MMNNPYKSGMQVPYGYPYPASQGGFQAPAAGAVPGYQGGFQAPTGGAVPPMPSGAGMPTGGQVSQAGVNVPGQLPIEQSFIENILRLNLGKMATIYMTFENNSEWNAKIFKGRLEAAGRDHIIISDPKTGMRYLLLMVNLDYITFEEELQYLPSFGGGGIPSGMPAGR